MQIFLECHDALAMRLAKVEPCPFAGVVTPDQIKRALAEFDIWPASILPDVIATVGCESLALAA